MTYSVPGSRSVGTGESVYKTVVIMSNILLSILTCNPHTQRSGNPKFTIFGNLFTLMMPIVAIDCIFSVNIQFSKIKIFNSYFFTFITLFTFADLKDSEVVLRYNIQNSKS